MEVETAALAIYTFSMWESLHTLSFAAALVIHTLEYFSWRHAHFLSTFCIYYTTCLTLVVPVFVLSR